MLFKGLKMFGKDFFRISKEILPHRKVADLVDFYYFWKKAPGSRQNQPTGGRRPNRRNGILLFTFVYLHTLNIGNEIAVKIKTLDKNET